MEKTDFLIIGAGIAGASVAAELAAENSVRLVEAECYPGYHATGRSAALFSEIYGNQIIRKLSRASRSRMLELAATSASDFTTPRGALFIATDAEVERLRVLAEQDDVRAVTRELDTHSTVALCSALRPAYAVAGLYEPNARDVDTNALHQAYLRRVRKPGSHVVTSYRVNRINRSKDVWEISDGTHDFAAPVLINAGGAWADQIASMASVRPLDLRPLRRTAILVDGPQGHFFREWPAVIAADESFYFKPDAGQLLLSPADETLSEPCDAQADEWDIAVAVDRVTAAAEIPVNHIRRRWAGLRTFAKDRTPVVGFDPEVAGFFWLAGQGGYGVQTASALAVVAAALARNRPIPAVIADFGLAAMDLSPARLQTPSKD